MGQVYLITGANGFVGRHLSSYLSSNLFDYHKLTRETTYFTQIQSILNSYSRGTIFYLIHCASAHRLNSEVSNIMYSNINSALTLVEALRQFRQIKSVINLSSISAYGDVQCDCLNEDQLFYNSNLYGASKLAVESIFDSYLISPTVGNLNLWHLRLPGIVGSGSYESSHNFMSLVKRSLINDCDLNITGYSNLFNNIVHIDTLIKIIIYLTQSTPELFTKIKHRHINICSTDPLPINEVITYMKEHLNSNSNIFFNKNVKSQFFIDPTLALRFSLPIVSTKDSLNLFLKD